MDNSVVIAVGVRGIRGLNGNRMEKYNKKVLQKKRK